jgi:hypothetical protein
VQQNAPGMTSAVFTLSEAKPGLGAQNLTFGNFDNRFPGIKNLKTLN